jgi:hypothetical protein
MGSGRWRLLLSCGLSLAFSQVAAANLIINGSFEFVGPAPGSPALTYTTDYAAVETNTLFGWTSAITTEPSAGNYLSTANSSANWIPNPFEGSYSMQLDSSTTPGAYAGGNSLSQTISLTSGVEYHLTFYMSAEAARGQATTSTLAVILNGGGFSNFTTSFTASATGTDTKATTGDWVLQTLDFTPTVTGDITLTFQDIYTPNGTSSNASLDNVDLEIVPEIPNGVAVGAFCLALVLMRKLGRFRLIPARIRARSRRS